MSKKATAAGPPSLVVCRLQLTIASRYWPFGHAYKENRVDISLIIILPDPRNFAEYFESFYLVFWSLLEP